MASPITPSGHIGIDMANHFESLGVATQPKRLHGCVKALAQSERSGIDLELACFDLREIEDVVDDLQQRIGRGLHHTEVIPLLAGQFGIEGQFGHTEDSVHRRANLMAHVGEELALGTAGGLGGFLRVNAVEPPPFSLR